MSDAVDHALVGLGYRCLHRSADSAKYLRGDERVDFIFAHRPMLTDAPSLPTPFGALRVVSTEGLIGLKLQAFVNDPRRTRDVEDIRALISANRAELTAQMSAPREEAPSAQSETFRDPCEALDDLMTVVEALCPAWPQRGTFEGTSGFKL